MLAKSSPNIQEETPIVLYVAYYRMEEMKAFFTAMIPLIAAEVFMVTLVGMVLLK